MPTKTNYPGVYVEEIPSGVRTIRSVSTSVAVFFGQTRKGPLNKAILLSAYDDYINRFGNPHPKCDLAYSVKLFFSNGGRRCYVVRLAHQGVKGTSPELIDYIGNKEKKEGFYALDDVDIFNLMIIPVNRDILEDEQINIWKHASIYCENHRAILIIDAPSTWTVSGQPTIVNNTIEIESLRNGFAQKNTAIYYPRLQFEDDGDPKMIGASGGVAGVFAKTDNARGVWKAPAGIEAVLDGYTGLEAHLTDTDIHSLSSKGINCIRNIQNRITVWGSRTLIGDNQSAPEWKYIPVLRLRLFIEESVSRGIKWVLFEANDEPLWTQIRLSISAFMHSLFRNGAFQGEKAQDAFFVKCDASTTTQDDIDMGIVNIHIGFAPLKPAEFVVINIQQLAGQIDG